MKLTAREKEIVKLMLRDRPCKMIADDLHIAVSTVRAHLANVYRRFRLSGQLSLVMLVCKKPELLD